MKKFFISIYFLLIASMLYGCNLNQNKSLINNFEIVKNKPVEYDIICSFPIHYDLEKLTTFRNKYENEIGVKIKIIQCDKSKLQNVLTSQEYPSLYCTNNSEDTMSLEKLGFAVNLSNVNNSTLKDKLNELDSYTKIPSNKTDCYGIDINNELDNCIISINSKSNDLEQKLAIEFLIYLLENQI